MKTKMFLGRILVLAAGMAVLDPAAPLAAVDPQAVGDGFYLPDGDAFAGRKAFEALNCAVCHQVTGDTTLPKPVPGIPAPALGFTPDTSSASIAQSIITPSHTIAYGYGKGDPEDAQSSPMMDLTEQMTIKQLQDIIAYLKTMSRETV